MGVMGCAKDVRVWTMVVGDYLPELCEVTVPTIEAYADRIGADFRTITERRHPDWPMTYEKVQLYSESRDGWTIFIDADTVVGEKMPDVTRHVPPGHVAFHMAYDAGKILPHDYWLMQDGRNVGVGTSFMAFQHGQRCLLEPFKEPFSTVQRRMLTAGTRLHIADEYCASRNLARHGLDFIGISQISSDFLHLDATTDGHEEALARAASWLDGQ